MNLKMFGFLIIHHLRRLHPGFLVQFNKLENVWLSYCPSFERSWTWIFFIPFNNFENVLISHGNVNNWLRIWKSYIWWLNTNNWWSTICREISSRTDKGSFSGFGTKQVSGMLLSSPTYCMNNDNLCTMVYVNEL